MPSPDRNVSIFVDLEHAVRRDAVRALVGQGAAHRLKFHLSWPPAAHWSLRGAKPDAVVALPLNRQHLAFLRSLNVPVVCLGSEGRDEFPSVEFDNILAGRLAADHLANLGLKRLGVLVTREKHGYSRDRRHGFCEEAHRRGCECRLFQAASHEHISASRLGPELEQWMAEADTPVGLLADTDAAGVSVLATAREIGLSVPERLSLISIGGDDLLCGISLPPLSSVVLPGHEMGCVAARLLVTALRSRRRRPVTECIPPVRLVERESSNVLATGDGAVALALRFIRSHSSQPLAVREVLRHVPVSRRALEMRFKKATGRTIQKEIWRTHLERAKELLLTTSFAMPDVADLSGFEDAQRLSEVFRREIGQSPRDYRRQHGTGALQQVQP